MIVPWLAVLGDLPQVWVGLAAAIIGILFWVVGLLVANWVFEHYLRDIDQPETDGPRQ